MVWAYSIHDGWIMICKSIRQNHAHKHQDVKVYKMKTTLCPVNKNNSGQDGK